MNGSVSSYDSDSEIVKEGWLLKRGEHIKNWRQRYFRLYKDGRLWGFKSPNQSEPINTFSANCCLVHKSEKKGKNFMFSLRWIQMTSVVVRLLATTDEEERQQWITLIQEVRMKNTMESIDLSQNLTLDDFQLIRLLGKGSFGKVILVKNYKTGEVSAMKVMKKQQIINQNEVAHIKAETNVLRHLRHPFLTMATFIFQTQHNICIGMEYLIGGDLFSLLVKAGKFTENRAQFYIAEVICGIGYLHSQRVIYRDLKLENVLIDKDGHIRIADFGLCKENISYTDVATTFCGTAEYLAPEVISSEIYGRAVDWWSVGILLYEMVTGKMPFHGSKKEVMESIISKEPLLPTFLSANSASILRALLQKDPEFRLGGGVRDIEDIKMHRFFSSLNWEDLEQKKIEPKWKPVYTDIEDTRNFDHEFTIQSVDLTPPDENDSLNQEDGVDPFDEF